MKRVLEYADPPRQEPRPSYILIINTFALVAMTLIWMALAVTPFVTDGTYAVAGLIIALGLGWISLLLLALRGSRTATKGASVLLTIGIVFLLAGAILNVAEALLSGDLIAGVAVAVVLIGVAAYVTFSAYLEWHWLRQLDPEDAG